MSRTRHDTGGTCMICRTLPSARRCVVARACANDYVVTRRMNLYPMPCAVAHERRRYIADAIQTRYIRGNLLVDVREIAGITGDDRFAAGIGRELHHLPRRPAVGRIVRRKHNGISFVFSRQDLSAAPRSCLTNLDMRRHWRREILALRPRRGAPNAQCLYIHLIQA
jgi:hypothetical protein